MAASARYGLSVPDKGLSREIKPCKVSNTRFSFYPVRLSPAVSSIRAICVIRGQLLFFLSGLAIQVPHLRHLRLSAVYILPLLTSLTFVKNSVCRLFISPFAAPVKHQSPGKSNQLKASKRRFSFYRRHRSVLDHSHREIFRTPSVNDSFQP
jgi:hypothetical protein